MAIKILNIEGLRGFSKKVEIEFAVPDGKNYGSGLTVLVGPNNSGKSTVIEAIHLLSTNVKTVPKSARNKVNDEKILIEAIDSIGNKFSLNSTENGGSYIERKYNDKIEENYWDNKLNTFVLTSKRNFSSTFNSNNYHTRENYKGNIGDSEYRTESNINSNFGGRLLNIYNRRELFENCLEKVLYPIPEWTIESENENTSYLEFSFNGVKHSSKGAGDGYINIFNVVDSLYDSSENNVILIDEPEISLHPDLQKKLFDLLVEYSKDKQIIISTHSPYFVNWELFSEHSKIIRFRKENEYIEFYELSQNSKNGIRKILNDLNNIHTLSLDANNIFFLQDNIILTEGQDDVICYPKIFQQYDYIPNASFFGWGAGGADNIDIILTILKDLGYQKVFTIVDDDRRESIVQLSKKYEDYGFYAIKAGDVHNKKRHSKIDDIIKEIDAMLIDNSIKKDIIAIINNRFTNKEGLISSRRSYIVNPKYKDDVLKLINNMKIYFESTKISKRKTIKTKDNKILEDCLQAKILLEKYISDCQPHRYIENKYKYLEFHAGSGGILSLSNIKDNVYYAIVEQYELVSEKHEILIQFHFIINTKKQLVKLRKKKVVKNTLPKKYKI